MRSISSVAVVLLVAAPAADTASADLLDRLRRKADEVSQEALEVGNDVETVTDIEGRAEAEVERAQAQAEQALPTGQKIENRARNETESTDAALAVRDVERDVEETLSADERAKASASAEASRIEAAVKRQTDVEGRAQAEIASTDAAVAAREAQREIDVAASTDERIEAEVDTVTSTDDRLEAEVEGTQEGVKRAVEAIKKL